TGGGGLAERPVLRDMRRRGVGHAASPRRGRDGSWRRGGWQGAVRRYVVPDAVRGSPPRDARRGVAATLSRGAPRAVTGGGSRPVGPRDRGGDAVAASASNVSQGAPE